MFRIILIISLFIQLMLPNSPVLAQDYLLISSPPSVWVKEKDGHLEGPLVDLLEEMFTSLGIEIRTQISSWERAISDMESGHLDILPVVFYTAEREKFMGFSVPYAQVHTSVFTPKNKSFDFHSINDLFGKKGVMMRGDSISQEFDAIKWRLNLTTVKSYDMMINMLVANRVDYAVAAKYGFNMRVEELNHQDSFHELTNYIASRNLHIAISKKSRYFKFLPRLNEKLLRMKNDGRLDEMINSTIHRTTVRHE